MTAPRTGILGGTFDPIHNGHVAIALQCRLALGLDEVRLIPSFQPPHREPPIAAADDRLAMTRLAAAGLAGLMVDDREVRRGGVSYAVDTLREMRTEAPERQLVFLLGQDAAAEFGSWREAAAVRQLARLAVFNRSGTAEMRGEALTAAGIPADAELLTVESPPVSASEVRRRLGAGEDVATMLPPSVLQYIRERGLYLAAS